MQSVELSIFRFFAQESYEYYFQKYPISYDTNLTLFDALESIPGLAFDKSMGLRVQGLCVFADVKLQELVEKFGVNLRIEPLSQKYVEKDLLINREAIYKRYEEFFAAHDFIAPSHRYELHKFLWANLVSLRDDNEYLGDGFFLYVHWLLACYPKHFDTLIHTIAGAQSGVMSYAPLEALIYKPNPHTSAISPIIEELIDKVARFGICPGCECAWISQLESMRPKALTQMPPLAPLESKAPKPTDVKHHLNQTANLAHTAESTPKRFMLFDAYTLREAAPMITSARGLLRTLGVELVDCAKYESFIAFGAKSGNFYAHIIEPELFIERIFYNLIIAYKASATLVFGDLEHYAYTKWALDRVQTNPALQAKIAQRFANMIDTASIASLLDTRVAFIGDFTCSSPSGSILDSFTFVAYPNTLLESALTPTYERNNLLGLHEPSKTRPSAPATRQNPNDTKNTLLELIALAHSIKTPAQRLGGKWLSVLECSQDFSHLYAFNREAYLTQSARVRFACIDSGADMIIVSSAAQFRAFTTHAREGAASIGRDDVQIPILYLSQLALLALGQDARCDSRTLRALERA